MRRTGTGGLDAGDELIDVTFSSDDSCDDAIDTACHDTYGHGSAVRSITGPQARATTLRVDLA